MHPQFRHPCNRNGHSIFIYDTLVIIDDKGSDTRFAEGQGQCTEAAFSNFCPKPIWDKSQFQVPTSNKPWKIKARPLSIFEIVITKVFYTGCYLKLRFVSNTFWTYDRYQKAAIVKMKKKIACLRGRMRLTVNDVDYRILDHIKKGDFIRSKV